MAQIILDEQSHFITFNIQEICITILKYDHIFLSAKLSYIIVYIKSVN